VSYKELLPEIFGNIVLIAFVATLVAKLNEAVFGRIYEALFSAFHVSEDAQGHWRKTLFVWAIVLGEAICLRAKIGFMPTLLPTPDTYILCGLLVGCGAGLVWDLLLDPTPDGPVALSEPYIFDGPYETLPPLE
jgi:hypothetical protein